MKLYDRFHPYYDFGLLNPSLLFHTMLLSTTNCGIVKSEVKMTKVQMWMKLYNRFHPNYDFCFFDPTLVIPHSAIKRHTVSIHSLTHSLTHSLSLSPFITLSHPITHSLTHSLNNKAYVSVFEVWNC
jgi:hypothetical protein